MTMARRAVLHVLVTEPDQQWYGFKLCKATGLRRGTVSPMLRGLWSEGLLQASWEDPEQAMDQGRPTRRYYWIPDEQVPKVRELLGMSP